MLLTGSEFSAHSGGFKELQYKSEPDSVTLIRTLIRTYGVPIIMFCGFVKAGRQKVFFLNFTSIKD